MVRVPAVLDPQELIRQAFTQLINNQAIPGIPLAVAMRYRKDQILGRVCQAFPVGQLMAIWNEEAIKCVDAFCETWITERNFHCKGGPLTHIPPQKPHVPLPGESRCQSAFDLGDLAKPLPADAVESHPPEDLRHEDR